MAPMRVIEKDYPLIDDDFQSFCASHGILTVEDFLIHNLHSLLAKAEHRPRPERNGDLREGQVTELAGPSSLGKTQVTSCDFQLVMNRILCCAVFDIFSMLSVLHQLESKLKCQIHGSVGIIRMLVIDSVSSLISPIFGGSRSQGRALRISAGSLLKKLAHCCSGESSLPQAEASVINHTVGGENGYPKPALGETWKTIPHARLMLSHDYASKTCCISILKHTSLARDVSARFVINV